MTTIHRKRDAEALAEDAAAFIGNWAEQRIQATGSFSMALAGGTTPKSTYRLLPAAMAQAGVDWLNVYIFWGDERCVDPGDAMSNYRMAHTTFLSQTVIPDGQIHPMRCETEPKKGAEEYESILRAHFAPEPEPRFDLVLLGLGPDGHTASLFPGSQAIGEKQRWVVAEFVQAIGGWRLSLTPVAINAAACVAFIVIGKEKSQAVQQVMKGDHDPASWPAQAIEPSDGELHWFLDEAAATLI